MVEQDGRIELLDHGVQSTFLDLASTGRVYTGPASGLFSVALAPDYEASGHLYVFYTRTAADSDRELGGDLQIDEFTATGDSVAVASRRPVLTIPQEPGPYHNGVLRLDRWSHADEPLANRNAVASASAPHRTPDKRRVQGP